MIVSVSWEGWSCTSCLSYGSKCIIYKIVQQLYPIGLNQPEVKEIWTNNVSLKQCEKIKDKFDYQDSILYIAWQEHKLVDKKNNLSIGLISVLFVLKFYCH